MAPPTGRTRHALRRVGGGASLALSLAACGPSAEQQERDAVLSSIDLLRSAPQEHAARIEAVRALRAAPATTELGKRARDECASAYELLATANDLEAKVRAAMTATGKTEPLDLADMLRRADAAIEASRGHMERCDQASTELRIRR